MKKLFISLCIILFTISCTNEEETNNYTPVDNQSNSTSEIILQERNSSLPRVWSKKNSPKSHDKSILHRCYRLPWMLLCSRKWNFYYR